MRTRLFGSPGPRPVPSPAVPAILTILLFLLGAVASARDDGRKPILISEQQAMDAVAKLPEVRAFGAMLERVANGTVRLSLYCEEKPRPHDQSWQVYVGESHADHTVVWNRFRVDAKTGDLAVWDDDAEDGWTPLGDWRRKAAVNERAVGEGRIVAIAAKIGSPARDVLDREAFTHHRNTGTESYKRVVQIGPKIAFRAFVETTNKGNGSLEIANLRLRVLDEHDDGVVFDPPLLNVEFVDVTGDGYKDIFLCGCLRHTGEKIGDPVSVEPVAYLYVFRPEKKAFALSYAHGPELDC